MIFYTIIFIIICSCFFLGKQLLKNFLIYWSNRLNQKINQDFIECCKQDNIKIAQSLWEVSQKNGIAFDIHADNENIFRWCCKKGKFEMIEWLWKISEKINSPINIHVLDEEPFCTSCENGHLDIAKWLWEKSNEINSPINIHIKNEFVFRWSCFNGRFDVVKWLWELSKKINSLIDIHTGTTENDEAFIWACSCGCNDNYLGLAKWFCELYPQYKIEYDEETKVISNYQILPPPEKVNDYTQEKMSLYDMEDVIKI
jgi:hypothetical protein